MGNAAWAVMLVLSMQSAPAQDPRREAWPDDRPITRLFQNLGHDLKALPSIETGLILGAGIGGALGVHPADDDLSQWAREAGPSSYTRLGRTFGDGWVQSGGAVGAYVVGRIAKDARLTHVGSDLIRAQVLNGLVTRGLKIAVHRERPSGGNRHSFPSGHASATFASAAVLHGHFGWKVGVPSYALAGFVGWTRARDNSHWLSDLAGGAAIGLVAGHTVTMGHRDRVWRVLPARTPGGFAVYVVRSAR